MEIEVNENEISSVKLGSVTLGVLVETQGEKAVISVEAQ